MTEATSKNKKEPKINISNFDKSFINALPPSDAFRKQKILF